MFPTQKQNEYLYVITGGPGSGKTSVIEYLKEKGFNCVEEVARQIIREEIEKDGNALPWKDTALYTRYMLERSVISYQVYEKVKAIHLMDRGIPDTLAYATLIQLKKKAYIQQAAEEYRYNSKVFIFPPWEAIYCTDKERKQSWDEAIQTYEVIKNTYQELGYELIEMPLVSVKERGKFIIKEIG